MKRGLFKHAWIGILALGVSGCVQSAVIQSLSLCGRMVGPSGQAVTSGTAAYHMIWIAGGVQYDSDEFGAPTAAVGADGKACFHGGVGLSAAMSNFKLVSLTVQVTGTDSGASYSGTASRVKQGYNGVTEELYMSADFLLEGIF